MHCQISLLKTRDHPMGRPGVCRMEHLLYGIAEAITNRRFRTSAVSFACRPSQFRSNRWVKQIPGPPTIQTQLSSSASAAGFHVHFADGVLNQYKENYSTTILGSDLDASQNDSTARIRVWYAPQKAAGEGLPGLCF